MVVNVYTLRLTRIHGTLQRNQKILPTRITQNGLQFTGKPHFHIYPPIITAYCMHYSVKSLLINIYLL